VNSGQEDNLKTYKMVQVPPNLAIAAKSMWGAAPSTSEIAAQYLERVVNDMAARGYAFERVDEIGVRSTPGCLAGFLGAKETMVVYYVITFSINA
jgi:hypothetical protein